MTTITIERELLEQALNALSAPNHCVFSEPPICVDIRAALSAPATAPDEHDDAMRAYVDADRAQQPPDASWRFAIDQARIVNCLDCTTSADDPVKSLAELIQWEVQTALDPSVSPAAQALIDQGLAMREQAAQPATAQAAEIERLKTESEERLQNCVALVAEVERLRKDAERYQWLAEYLVSDDESYDDVIVAATTVAELDYVIDAAMKGTP